MFATLPIRMSLSISVRAVAYLPDLPPLLIEESTITLPAILGHGIYNGIRRISLRNMRMFPLRPIIGNNDCAIFMIPHL